MSEDYTNTLVAAINRDANVPATIADFNMPGTAAANSHMKDL